MDSHRCRSIVALAATACLLTPPLHADLPSANKREVHPPSGDIAMAPRLTAGSDGAALLSWMEAIPGQAADTPRNELQWRMRFARFSDGEWSQPRTVVAGSPGGRDFFVNWADVPSITQARDGWLLAHWLESSGDHVYAYDVMLARSDDNGRTWRQLGPAHDDGTETEHGFVSTVLEGDGIRLFWLDGREMQMPGDGHGHGGGHGGHAGDGAEGMQLRTALITDAVGESTVLDPRVCECCGTDAVMTSRGPVIVYRDRALGEIRDISIVRQIDDQWTEPRTVHDDDWGISGCPVNGPAIAAAGDTLAVAWFTMAHPYARVQVAFSEDGGATFAEPIEIDADDGDEPGGPLGRVDIVMRDADEAIVCWLASARGEDGEEGVILAQRVGLDGLRGDAIEIARTSPGRISGFPKIALIDGGILTVWTDAGETTRLRAAVIDL